MSRFLRLLTLACACAYVLMAPAGASAAATFQPSGAVAFTGTNVGAHVFTLQGGTPSITCSTVTITGTKPAGTPVEVGLSTAMSNCTTTIISPRPASFTNTTPEKIAAWTAAFTAVTGAIAGLWRVWHKKEASVPSIPACKITVDSQTVTTGTSGQNRTAGDSANAPAGGAAAGMRIIQTAAPLAYTASGCPGVTSPGTGSYSGTWYVPGIWAGP